MQEGREQDIEFEDIILADILTCSVQVATERKERERDVDCCDGKYLSCKELRK